MSNCIASNRAALDIGQEFGYAGDINEVTATANRMAWDNNRVALQPHLNQFYTAARWTMSVSRRRLLPAEQLTSLHGVTPCKVETPTTMSTCSYSITVCTLA